MTIGSLQHDGISSRPGGETTGRLAMLCLVLLVAFLPLTRVAVQLLIPSGGATAIARLQVGIMELLFIIAVFADRRVTIPALSLLPKAIVLLMAAWLGWSLLAVSLSAVPGMALARQVEWVLHATFGWTVWAFIRTYPHSKDAILVWLIRGFLLYALLISFFLLNIPNPEEYPWVNGILGFANVRHFGYYVAIVLVAAHAPLLREAPRRERLGQVLVLTVVWAFLAWSGSRGPIFATVGSLAVLTVFRPLPQAKRIWGLTVLAAVMGAMISIPFTPPDGAFGILRFAETIQQAEGIAQYSGGRMEFWGLALDRVLENPLLGLGPDQLLVAGASGRFYGYVQPHDLMLQTALEWGIPGALMFLTLLAVALLAGLRKARETSSIGLWIALMLAALSLIDGTFYHALPMMAVALGLALTFASVPASEPRHTGRTLAMPALALVCGLTTAVSAVSFWAILASDIPHPDSWRVRMVQLYPSPLGMLGGSTRLDRWARDWAQDTPEAAYALTDWTVERSRMPWTSLQTRADIMLQSGETAAGRRALEKARSLELAVTGRIRATAPGDD